MAKPTYKIGLDVALCLVFISLKMSDVIDWSWWWVFSPLWVGVVLVGLINTLKAIVSGDAA